MLMAIPFPDLSPEIFSIEIFGKSFALRWYALAYIAGILIGWRIALAAVKRPAITSKTRAKSPSSGAVGCHSTAVFSAW